jgi:three-Cys-motif partner protein
MQNNPFGCGPWWIMPVDHEFGAQHTELKLSIIEAYLKRFMTALRPRFAELWYIDAFAGTGSRTEPKRARATYSMSPSLNVLSNDAAQHRLPLMCCRVSTA